MSKRNWLSIEFWFFNLIRAFITGAVGAGGSALGVVGADYMGFKVPSFTPRQFLIMMVWSGVLGTILYLKKSPLPDIVIDNESTTKPTCTCNAGPPATPPTTT